MSFLKKLLGKPVSVIQNLTPNPQLSDFITAPRDFGEARVQIAAADIMLRKLSDAHMIVLRQLLYDCHHREYPCTFIVADKPIETYLAPELNGIFFTTEKYSYAEFVQLISTRPINRNQVYKFEYTHAIAKNPDVTEKWLLHFKKKYALSDTPTVYKVTLVPGIASVSRLVFLHSFITNDPFANLSVCDADLDEYVFKNNSR